MHSMYSRTTTYVENIHHTWWVKQCFPVGLCKAERHQYVVQITNTKKERPIFPRVVESEFHILVSRVVVF